MDEASEAVAKAIEAIEKAAPSAWRLTVEGYAADLKAEIIGNATGAVVVSLLLLVGVACGYFAKRRWKDFKKEPEKEKKYSLAKGDAQFLAAIAALSLLAWLALTALFVGRAAKSYVRLQHVEGYAAKHLLGKAVE